MPKTNSKTSKCLKCKGIPAQHNIYDETIVITDNDGNVTNEVKQHNFVYTTSE